MSAKEELEFAEWASHRPIPEDTRKRADGRFLCVSVQAMFEAYKAGSEAQKEAAVQPMSLKELSNEQLSDVQQAVRDCYDRDLYRTLFEEHLRVCTYVPPIIVPAGSVEAGSEASRELGDPPWPLYQEYVAQVPPRGQSQMTYSGWLRTLAANIRRQREIPASETDA